jgi:hypothetical protein
MTNRYVVIPGDPEVRALPILLTGEGMVVDTTTPEIGYGFGSIATLAAAKFESGEFTVDEFGAVDLTATERDQLATVLGKDAA